MDSIVVCRVGALGIAPSTRWGVTLARWRDWSVSPVERQACPLDDWSEEHLPCLRREPVIRRIPEFWIDCRLNVG